MRSFCLLFLCSIVVLAGCKKDNGSACSTPPVAHDKYIYPVKPGTAAWNNLTSGNEHLKACQIPDSVLTKISTEGLIQSWLDFPLVSEIFLGNSIPQGVDFFVSNFSGLEQLSKRKDAGEKLYNYYQTMNPACVSNIGNDSDRGGYTFSFTYVEVLLAKDTILNTLTTQNKKLVVAEAVNKYNTKNQFATDFGGFGTSTALFVCGRVMVNSQYSPFLNEVQGSPFLSSFLNDLRLPADEAQASDIRNIILKNSMNFIK